MGVWDLLGRIINISPKESIFIANVKQGSGRIIYEHYDDSVGGPSTKSRFFILKSAKTFPRKGPEGQEVASRIEVDITDPNMVEELITAPE